MMYFEPEESSDLSAMMVYFSQSARAIRPRSEWKHADNPLILSWIALLQ